MFGYVRPLTGELKVCELERFRSCYCSLCHALERDYGLPARFILNYDFVFLAMLLWQPDAEPQAACRRCAVHPLHKTCIWQDCTALSCAAGCSVILAWWKLRDNRADGRFFQRLKAGAAMLALRRAYRRAKRAYPAFDGRVRQLLGELAALEKAGETSIDRVADKFAQLLAALADYAPDAQQTRVCRQLLYHLGRWIYLADAADDLVQDARTGAYNALAAHFECSDGRLNDAQKELVRATLVHSSNQCVVACALLPQTRWTPVIRNILYLGLPDVCGRVLSGTYHSRGGRFAQLNGEEI